MKVENLTYNRRINLGNYEFEEVALTVKLTEGETAKQALGSMKQFVDSFVAATKSKDLGSMDELNNETNS